MSSISNTGWLTRSLLRLSPHVFFHHIWIDFVHTRSAFSSHLIEELHQAAKQLVGNNDLENACQIWLICAALENQRGDNKAALSLADKTAVFAQNHHLPQIAEWANWGASSLCARQGDWQQATDYLQRLQQVLNDQGDWMLASVIYILEGDLAQLAAKEQALTTYQATDPQLATVLEQFLHWETPMPTLTHTQPRPRGKRPSYWQSLWRALTNLLKRKPSVHLTESRATIIADMLSTMPAQASTPSPPVPPELVVTTTDQPSGPERMEQVDDRPFNPQQTESFPLQSDPQSQLESLEFPDSDKEQVRRQTPIRKKDDKEPILIIYCLGTFRVYHNTNLIVDWNGLKGQLIFKYLVTQQGKPIPKDVLMELIWPEADPDAARRNLHQAIYSLRKTLKKHGADFQPIRYENACYLFDPTIEIWLDYKEFEQHVKAGRQLEQSNLIAQAMAEYGIAEGLYQGDFLAEDIYEDWTYPLREQLQRDYVDITNRLSEQYFLQNEYTAAIAICQKLLVQDNCHEDAHRRLMRCYLAQSQRHSAIRQYHHCRETLLAELNITPTEETKVLFRELINR